MVLWSALKKRLLDWLGYLGRPRMIYGFKRIDRTFLKNTRISNTVVLIDKQKLMIEDHVYIGHYNIIDASNELVIREGCQITNFISLLTHSSHLSIRLYGKEYLKQQDLVGYVKGRVEIGAYTFIGPHSVIMPGTTIGKGCLVKAYSYVKGDFPDFSIISGCPARVAGDTRYLDEPYLTAHEPLKDLYQAWAGFEQAKK